MLHRNAISKTLGFGLPMFFGQGIHWSLGNSGFGMAIKLKIGPKQRAEVKSEKGW